MSTLPSPLGRLRGRIQAALFAGMPDHVRRLSWTAERIAAHQEGRLRALLAERSSPAPGDKGVGSRLFSLIAWVFPSSKRHDLPPFLLHHVTIRTFFGCIFNVERSFFGAVNSAQARRTTSEH
jgi:hypothetical protein